MTYDSTENARMDVGALVSAVLGSWLRISVVTIILLGTTFFLLSFVPKQYESTASLLVESRTSAFTIAANEVSSRFGSADPSVVTSQVELLRSRDTLLRVIEQENLRDVPELNGEKKSLLSTIFGMLGRSPSAKTIDERVLFQVKKRLKVAQQRSTRVITIYFRSTDPRLSARVANSIANTHVARRAELSASDTVKATEWLSGEITIMRQRVAEAEAKVAKYRVNNDLFVGTNNTSLLDQQLTVIATQISSAQERKGTAQSRGELIRGLLEAGKSIEGVPDVRSSVVVQALSQDKARLQAERAQLLATLLPNHPSVQALSARIVEVDKQVRIEGRQVADALEAEAKIQATLISSLRDDLARLKLDVSGATRSGVTLSELEREAKAQRDLLATYLLRYRDASARTDATASLPDVRVVTAAAPSIKSVAPKKFLILLAVGIVSLTFQVGQILTAELLSGRAIREPGRPDAENTFSADMEPTISVNSEADDNDKISAGYVDHIDRSAANVVGSAPSNSTQSFAQNITEMSEQISTSKQRIVLVANMTSGTNEPGAAMEIISTNLIQRGGSVAEIDAGSRRASIAPGLSDLCSGRAEFGDVVRRNSQSNFASVTWGQNSMIDLNSPRCRTLITALGEIFETTLIDVGRIGLASSLPFFTNYNALVILLVDREADIVDIDNIRKDMIALGYTNIRVVTSPSEQSEVA